MLKKTINIVKKALQLFRKKKEKFYPTPYRYGIIDWTDYSKKHGMSEKKLKIIESGDIAHEEPLTEAVMQVYSKKIPIFDSTQGKKFPSYEIFEEIDPSTIKHAW